MKPRIVTAAPKRTKTGNARRGPRPRREPSSDGARPVDATSGSGSAGGTRLGRVARTGLRIAVRVGLCAGLAYGVLVGVREGYAYATTSPRFEVRALEFRATAHVDEARLRELLALAPGTNILSLQLDELAERVAAEPWVARAVVNRELPDALRVEIEEHQATAVLAAGVMLLVDAQGEPFKRLESGERGQLPVITGVDGTALVADPEGSKVRITRALDVVAAYAEKRRPLLSEVHIDTAGGVTLYTANVGSQLRIGRGDPRVALARFDALRAALGEESDKLAVAHLDGATVPDRADRVVASFFPAKDVPQLVVDAHERAANGAAVREAASAEASPEAPPAPAKHRAPRIPRHH